MIDRTEEICRLGAVNSKSFVGTIFLRVKWKFELQLKAIVISFNVDEVISRFKRKLRIK